MPEISTSTVSPSTMSSVGSSVPIQIMSFDVGTRRPLTALAAGVAILIALPEAEAQAIVARQLAGEVNRSALHRMW
jgi:DNA-binding IclR family transcriptional regulator